MPVCSMIFAQAPSPGQTPRSASSSRCRLTSLHVAVSTQAQEADIRRHGAQRYCWECPVPDTELITEGSTTTAGTDVAKSIVNQAACLQRSVAHHPTAGDDSREQRRTRRDRPHQEAAAKSPQAWRDPKTARRAAAELGARGVWGVSAGEDVGT